MADITIYPGKDPGGESSYGSGSAVTLSTSAWTEVGIIRGLTGRRGLATIELLVAAQTLANLKLSGSNRSGAHVTDSEAGGTKVDLLVDADFLTANSVLDFVAPAPALPVAVGTRILMRVRVDGLEELGLYAKTSVSGGTLTITRVTLPMANR